MKRLFPTLVFRDSSVLSPLPVRKIVVMIWSQDFYYFFGVCVKVYSILKTKKNKKESSMPQITFIRCFKRERTSTHQMLCWCLWKNSSKALTDLPSVKSTKEGKNLTLSRMGWLNEGKKLLHLQPWTLLNIILLPYMIEMLKKLFTDTSSKMDILSPQRHHL